MSEMDQEARRRQQIADLRAAAGSTTPEAYRVRTAASPVTDPMAETKETYTTLFGVFTKDRSPREAISIICMVGCNGLAYILLILVLNLAQCSWWYEPGMYSSGFDREQRIGR